MSDAFFEMIKKWTVFDHYTPGLKAEVIWDMLLSDYIPELICFHENNADRFNEYRLVAKEFPISAKDPHHRTYDPESDLSNARIDYLVESSENIYIVELKTTGASFDKDQYKRYKYYLDLDESKENPNGAQMLWDFFCNTKSESIIEKNIRPTYFGKPEDANKEKYIKHVKYKKQAEKILQILERKIPFSSEPESERTKQLNIKKELIQVLSRDPINKPSGEPKSVKLIYISLYSIEYKDKVIDFQSDMKKSKGSIDNIVLDNILKDFSPANFKAFLKKVYNDNDNNNAKLSNWDNISDIINEIISTNKEEGIYF